MLHGLLKLTSIYPPWLFGLRLAANLTNIILLLFGIFLLTRSGLTAPVVAYGVLIVLFCWANLRALKGAKQAQGTPMRWLAQLANVALPLAYLAGAWYSAALAVDKLALASLPALLNGFALEETLRFSRARPNPRRYAA